MLAQKVCDMLHQKRYTGRLPLTRKVGEILTLQELARDVVADNFELYPQLSVLPERIKAEVIGLLVVDN